jgi:hypothetical protein
MEACTVDVQSVLDEREMEFGFLFLPIENEEIINNQEDHST